MCDKNLQTATALRRESWNKYTFCDIVYMNPLHYYYVFLNLHFRCYAAKLGKCFDIFCLKFKTLKERVCEIEFLKWQT